MDKLSVFDLDCFEVPEQAGKSTTGGEGGGEGAQLPVSLVLSEFPDSYLFLLFFNLSYLFCVHHVLVIFNSYLISFCIFFSNFRFPLKNFLIIIFISYFR